MHYLTSAEMAKIWGISLEKMESACRKGQIAGAVERDRQWLIPEDASMLPGVQPVSMQDAAESPNCPEQKYDADTMDARGVPVVHQTGDVYKNLGVTRETLRYYEKLGLVEPLRDRENEYRKFNFTTIVRLMVIDFYKKRGFSAKEVSEIAADDAAKFKEHLIGKERALDDRISNLQKIRQRLADARTFYEEAKRSLNAISIKEFPSYKILGQIPSISRLDLYESNVLANLDAEHDDILSSQIRALYFDQDGFQNDIVYIVSKGEGTPQADAEYLQCGQCIYTVVELSSVYNPELPDEMRDKLRRWANENHKTPRGVVYLCMKMGAFHATELSYFLEVWVPVD